MGQRLNIEIKRKKDGVVLANCYYHWSAYTSSAIELTNKILDNLSDFMEANECFTDDEIAMLLLQTTGAGVEEDDYNLLLEENKKHLHLATSRNLGLISFTKDSMETTRKWEEGRVTITIDFDYFKKENGIDKIINKNKYVSVNFDVLWHYDDFESAQDSYEDFENVKEEDIPVFSYDFTNMSIDDMKTFRADISDVENDEQHGVFKNNGEYFASIW